jgi:glyoxylase-like metal-dependent hydrolase (beta-lactamase superfamily II)
MASFEIVTFPVGALQCNCSIIFHAASKSTVIVDPGDDTEMIFDCLKGSGFPVKALWHTHAHLDHIGATKGIFEKCATWNATLDAPAPRVFLYQDDMWLYQNVPVQAAAIGLNSFDVMQPSDLLVKQSTILLPDTLPELISFKTPGHTPGSACMRIEGDCDFQAPQEYFQSKAYTGAKALFSGDTLFRRSIGRTDLWGGNQQQIEISIRKHLYTLPEEYLVIPGHGAFTTLEEEKKKNAFVPELKSK